MSYFRGLARQSAPLVRHGFRQVKVSAAPVLPAVPTLRDTILPIVRLVCPPSRRRERKDVRWAEWRQVLQPKAGRLTLGVSKLPRLQDLVRLPDAGGNAAYRVLECDPKHWRRQEKADKRQGILCQRLPFGPALVPMKPGRAKVGARRMGDHEVPRFRQEITHVTLTVWTGAFRWEQVARNRGVPSGEECIADNAGELASNEHAKRAGHARRQTSTPCLALPRERAPRREGATSTR